MQPELEILTIESMPFAENSYLLWRKGSQEALVVDPGLEPDLILEALQTRGLKLAAILNTHGHADHIAGNEAMKRAFPAAPLIIGENEKHLLTDPMANVSGLFGFAIVSPPADQTVRDGDVIEFAGIRLEVYEIPGHSPGHVVFVHRGEPCVVLSGDVLFDGSIGRTDFPGGSLQTLQSGIRGKLYTLPESAVVYPGHGATTTIGREKKHNPFVPG